MVGVMIKKLKFDLQAFKPLQNIDTDTDDINDIWYK